MCITSPQVPGTHTLLNDTGAQISAISLSLTKKNHISIHPVKSGDPAYLLLAAKKNVIPRIGTVNIEITVHFQGGAPKPSYTCRKTFEVLDMDYDFILGIDLLPHIFPHDDIMNYLILPSPLSSPPSHSSHSTSSLHSIVSASDSPPFTLQHMQEHALSNDMQVLRDQQACMREYVAECVWECYDRLFDFNAEASARMCSVDRVRTPDRHLQLASTSASCIQSTPTLNSVSTMQIHTDTHSNVRTVHVPNTHSTVFSDSVNISAISPSESLMYDQDLIHDIGIGGIPASEIPDKPVASTPADKNSEYKYMREKIVSELSDMLRRNEQITGFCTGEGSVVTLSVRADDEKYIYTPQYHISQSLEAAVDECLKRWYDQGRIAYAPSGCKFNSPLLAVLKKDDHGKMTGVRVCIDIRKLNKYLIEDDKFQIPHIPDMLRTLAGGRIFGEFDLSEAYFQFRVADKSQVYTAFTWKKQQYVFVGCPYGIKHIPSLFQRFIAQLFKDMPFVFTYIDNICFSSRNWKEHMEHAAAIIERLNSVNLRIKPSSVNIGNYQIRLLGHILTPSGIGIDPEKQQIMMQWPRPETGSELASFLGLGTFLRDHIRHYADLTAPLEKVKKMKEIVWSDELNQSWLAIRRAFATAPFLQFPDFTKRFAIATDASQTGIGGVLYQPDDDEDTITKDNIVAIVSKQLNESQRRYPVYKKELWAVIYCLRKFHTFVHGRRDVHVMTDHKPLIHILKQQTLSTALQQWLDVLLDYDLTIKYRPGILHVIPDALSRMYMSAYTDTTCVWGTQSNVKIIDSFGAGSSPSDFLCQQSIGEIKPPKPTRRRHATPTSTLRSGGGNDNDARLSHLSTISSLLDDDPSAAVELAYSSSHIPLFHASTALHYASLPSCLCSSTSATLASVSSSSSVASSAASLLSDDEKLLLAQEKRGKKVPDDETQKQLLSQAHAAGHFGEKFMYTYIEKKGYWWPHMRSDISQEIKNCRECARYNITHSGFHPSRSVSASGPTDHCQIDLAEFDTSVDGYKYLLVMVDVFTGFVMLRPLLDKTASSVARALWEIFCVIGVPRILQSDNGSEFSNKIISTLCRLTGINRRFIAPYNPRADGKVERAVKTIKDTIVKLLHGASALWPLYVPFVQLVYNNKVQDLTGSSPFSLMFGRAMNELKDYTTQPHAPVSLSDWKEHQEKIVSLVFPSVSARIAKKQEKMRNKLDALRKKVTSEELSPGTVVMIKDPLYLLHPSTRPTSQPEWIGPYTIVRRTLYGPYLLRDDTGDMYHRQVNLDQMKVLFRADMVPSHRQHDDENTYEVDYVVSHRERDGVYEYKVKWKGYDMSDCTWENEEAFNDPQPVERYWKLQAAKQHAKRVSLMSLHRDCINGITISL